MQLKYSLFLLLVVALVIGDAEAGWKFWKKKDKDKDATTTTTTTTTVAPIVDPKANNGKPGTGNANPANPGTRPNTNQALANAANPGLAVGVGTTGDDLKKQAAQQPRRPNPGTDVGLDISAPKQRPGIGGAANGQGYRDWAADLTGAGEPGRQSPKLPSQGPAITGPGSKPGTPTGSQPQTPIGGKPGQQSPPQQPLPGAPSNQPAGNANPVARPQAAGGANPNPAVPGGNQRPQSTGELYPGPQGGNQKPQQPQPQPQPQPRPRPQPQPAGSQGQTGPQVSTLNIGPLTPGSKPGSPTTGQRTPGGASPTGTGMGSDRTWAQIAAGGSQPGSPQPSRPGSPQATRPGSPLPGAQGNSGMRTPTAGQGGTRAAGAAVAAGAAGAAGAAAIAGASKVYSSNPTYSKGNGVTDEDLEKLSEALNIKDNNNANKYVTLNLQKQTSSSSPTDEASQPLLTVDPEALKIPTIERVLSIYDNYNPDTKTNEYISPAQRQEESLLVDTFLSTNVMSTAMRFLADKGYIRKDYYEYKDTLRRLWFNLFSRGEGKIGSAGFEHVFLTELKSGATGTEVLGLHNWIFFHNEEKNNRANYLGYIKKLDLGTKGSIVKIHSKYNGFDKPVTTMFVGTSPELEMALYTVCFFVREDKACPVSLSGNKFNIVTHKFRYRGKDLIGTAYPDI